MNVGPCCNATLARSSLPDQRKPPPQGRIGLSHRRVVVWTGEHGVTQRLRVRAGDGVAGRRHNPIGFSLSSVTALG